MRGMGIARTLAVWLCQLGIVGILGVLPAQADEWYVGGLVGGAFPFNGDLNGTSTGTSTTSGTQPFTIKVNSTASHVPIDSSPVVGLKAGFCPRFFPYVCAEVDYNYFQPDIGQVNASGQTTISSSTSSATTVYSFGMVPGLDTSVHAVGVNLLGRKAFFAEPGYPLDGRLHLYLGAGPAFVVTRAKLTQCFRDAGSLCGQNATDTDFSVGAQALGGARFFITKNLSVFGEYKFLTWRSSFSFAGGSSSVTSIPDNPPVTTTTAGNTQISKVTYDVNLFYIGLAYHFH